MSDAESTPPPVPRWPPRLSTATLHRPITIQTVAVVPPHASLRKQLQKGRLVQENTVHSGKARSASVGARPQLTHRPPLDLEDFRRLITRSRNNQEWLDRAWLADSAASADDSAFTRSDDSDVSTLNRRFCSLKFSSIDPPTVQVDEKKDMLICINQENGRFVTDEDSTKGLAVAFWRPKTRFGDTFKVVPASRYQNCMTVKTKSPGWSEPGEVYAAVVDSLSRSKIFAVGTFKIVPRSPSSPETPVPSPMPTDTAMFSLFLDWLSTQAGPPTMPSSSAEKDPRAAFMEKLARTAQVAAKSAVSSTERSPNKAISLSPQKESETQEVSYDEPFKEQKLSKTSNSVEASLKLPRKEKLDTLSEKDRSRILTQASNGEISLNKAIEAARDLAYLDPPDITKIKRNKKQPSARLQKDQLTMKSSSVDSTAELIRRTLPANRRRRPLNEVPRVYCITSSTLSGDDSSRKEEYATPFMTASRRSSGNSGPPSPCPSRDSGVSVSTD
ncbi:uncharacterized protein [Oscarella lobularis]|uniref:uncharacterized protein n=1 Tax=Oscarella lobularis TaxID=121494 RepID=UPI0033139F21